MVWILEGTDGSAGRVSLSERLQVVWAGQTEQASPQGILAPQQRASPLSLADLAPLHAYPIWPFLPSAPV